MIRHWMWLAAGVLVIVSTIVIAASNLREIYFAQKDFVVGSLLSLAGFAFGKSLDKSKQQRDEWLLQAGVFGYLHKLEAHLRSSDSRLSEHYWTYTDDPPTLLTVAHEDLNAAVIDLDRLRHALQIDLGSKEWPIARDIAIQLNSIRRDMREALNRLSESRTELETTLPENQFPETWAVFVVLRQDLLKANWNLDSLAREWVDFPPVEQVRRAANYLRAAVLRADEFHALLRQRQTEEPTTFTIMRGDLAAALVGLDRLPFDAELHDEPATGRVADTARRPPTQRPQSGSASTATSA